MVLGQWSPLPGSPDMSPTLPQGTGGFLELMGWGGGCREEEKGSSCEQNSACIMHLTQCKYGAVVPIKAQQTFTATAGYSNLFLFKIKKMFLSCKIKFLVNTIKHNVRESKVLKRKSKACGILAFYGKHNQIGQGIVHYFVYGLLFCVKNFGGLL